MPLIGYARVSTEDQDTAAQTDALRAAGCAEIVEERASGASRTRPLLARALARIRAGDTLVVARIDRLARSLAHLLAVIEELRAHGAHFRSLGDPIDTSSPQGLFTLPGGAGRRAAEFERALIRERTRAGLAAARARGRIGGNPALRARDPAARAPTSAAARRACRAGRADRRRRGLAAGGGSACAPPAPGARSPAPSTPPSPPAAAAGPKPA